MSVLLRIWQAATPRFWMAAGAWLLVLILALFGGHDARPDRLRDALGARVEKTLADQGFSAIRVRMRGQEAVLDGAAETDAAREEAVLLALTAAGPGGPWSGGVTNVDRRLLEVRAAPRLFFWQAVKLDNGGVLIDGATASPDAKEDLAAAANKLLAGGGKLDDRSDVAPGAPGGGAAWKSVALAGLAQLARLTAGEVRLIGNELIIIGEASQANSDAIREFESKGLEGFRVVADVVTPNERDVLVLPGLEPTIISPDSCQRALNSLAASGMIQYDPKIAGLASETVPFMHTLAAIIRRCDQYVVEINAAWGESGERNLNGEESRAYAEAVRSRLIDLGADGERVVTGRFGLDASPGRSAGVRRIEFVVRPL